MATTNSTSGTSNPAQDIYDSLNQKTTTKKSSATDDAQTRFLTMLTTQLKNQDPLNPMDNAQMTSQLAQISTVDGIERLNATLSKLIDGQNQSQTYQAAALVGHGVLVPGSSMTLASGVAVAGVDLSGPADKVSVEIRDSNGLLVRNVELGSQEAGALTFAWDGLTNAGEAAADGNYTFTVTATQGGEKVAADRLAYGLVNGVVNDANGLSVNVGTMGSFTMDDIKTII